MLQERKRRIALLGASGTVGRCIVDRLLALPDDTIVLPGHMEQTTIGQERARNPYVRMELSRREGA